ncbi:MAG: DMT family transporter [Bacteroidales bacterium]|nr:DMT family transporter [Bacteroidales bacterium]MDD3701847.1 DMT family transporter [Bacteroidales bacterium]MDY0370436.1 DMT family transporter [Bacteroidales bacterium]
MNTTIKVHISALLAMIFWGMSFIWSKQVFTELGPGTTIFFRLIISSPFLMLLLYLSGSFQKIRRTHYKLFLLTALFNPFLYFVGESYGLNLVSPTISAVIIATIPVFTPVATWLFTNERLSWLNLAGIFVSFIGILIMLVEKDFSLSASPTGILLLFGAVASSVIYSLIVKRTTTYYSALNIVWIQNTIGILYFLPLFLIETKAATAVHFSTAILPPLLLLGTLASSLAFVLFTYAIGKIGVSRSNIYTNLISVFTAFFSFLLLGEHLAIIKIAGIGVVITGVMLSQLPQKSMQTLNKTL